MCVSRCGIRRLCMLVGMVVAVSWLVTGCATTPPPAPGPSAAEVGQRIAALEECMTRSQRTVEAALQAGASAGAMGPANSSIADAQDALDEARQLLQQGKTQDAMDRVNQALEDCNKIDAMVQQARDEALERSAQARLLAQTEARLGQLTTCVDNAEQAIQAAKNAGATDMELRAAKNSAENARVILDEAKDLLAKGEVQRAAARLDIAQSDCQAAQDMANKVGMAAASRKPNSYKVVGGDTLWGISGRAPIYANPFMWPLIYKANREKIRDPDLIYPNQEFSIPRNASQEETNSAIRRARTRGPWRMGDGPDYYILEGVRR